MKTQARGGALPWYRTRWLGVEIGPTGHNDKDPKFMSRATGQEIIEQVVKAAAEYAVIFFKDWQYAYYDSKVAPKCPGIGQRNLFTECVEEARKHDLPIIAYCIVQHDGATYQAHPEWRMKDVNGKDIAPRLCYQSGYLHHVKQIADEMMQYDIVGFHFDMLDFGFQEPYGCWCDTCRGLFRDKYGMDMPAAVTWDEAWDRMLQFRADSSADFCHAMDEHVRSRRPELSVDYNYHGYPPFTWEVGEKPVQHAQAGDFVTAEGLPWVFGHGMPSLLPLFMAGARPGTPVQGVTSRFLFNYHDYTVRPAAEMEWEVSTYRAHGAQCTIVDKSNYDGTLDPVAFDRIGQAFRNVKRKDAYFGHKPLPEVGIYYSCRSRDWYGRQDRFKYVGAFAGAHRVLVQSHIPMGMVMDENVTLDRLREFPVVYLPNTAILSEHEVALLRQFVLGGGNLLVSGFTGLCDHWGNVRGSSDIEELVGARLVQYHTEHADNYIRLPASLAAGEGDFLLQDIPADWPMLTWGPIAAFEPTTARAFGELLTSHVIPQDAVNIWSQVLSADNVVGPAVLVNQFGKGKVVYLPCCVASAYVSEYGMPEHRKLIRNLVRYLHPDPDVEIDAPLNVETVVNFDQDNNRLLVHFICFNGQATVATFTHFESRRVLPPMMEEPAHYKVRVGVKRTFSDVAAVGADSKLSKAGNEISLETSEIHEVLVVNL